MTAPSLRPSLPAISDELLSAYLDGQVTAAESARVEQARAQDGEVAMRLDLLAETVGLLRQTPRLAVPRSFVLSETQVLAAGGRVKGAQPARGSGGFWAWLGRLSPRAMPLATAAVALALLLVVGADLGSSRLTAPAPAPQAAVAPEAVAAESAVVAETAAAETAPAATAEPEAALKSMVVEEPPAPEATPALMKALPVEDAAPVQTEAGDATAEAESATGAQTPAPAGRPPLRLLELALAGLLAALAALTLLARRARPA